MRNGRKVSRRGFVQAASMAGAASVFTIVKPQSVRGAPANEAVTLAWVGAGGRGTADARGLVEAGGRVIAVADPFQDRLDRARKAHDLDESKCFRGVDAYKRVMDLPVDAVILTTPPGFRPDQFVAAVDAGKHVFMEKPIAVDAWGCRAVLEAGEKAKAKKLSVVVGLQRRYSKAYQEAQKRIAAGALGTIVAGRGFYLTQDVWGGRHWPRTDFESDLLWMVRNWYYFRWLSGDLITEQNVHNLDACNWVLGGPPERCVGFGGRKWRKYVGDIFDHFNVTFEYQGGVHLTFMSGQFCSFHDSSEQICGTDATFSNSGRKEGGIRIEGKNPWEWTGEDDANKNEWEAFIASVKKGQPRADTQHGVEGTFTTILGREAAYRRQAIEWKKLWDENQKLEQRPYPVS
ncbi:Gfo/Idh/MocA family oxidoreductase [Candidatus Sumerlaeota bacterium]|nr:Gfo/Idh/MocA family oxidoreductase [Candidatus Sumerlaeota bacterium]